LAGDEQSIGIYINLKDDFVPKGRRKLAGDEIPESVVGETRALAGVLDCHVSKILPVIINVTLFQESRSSSLKVFWR